MQRLLILFLLLAFAASRCGAQGNLVNTVNNTTPRDTSKTNTGQWRDEGTRVYFTTMYSELHYAPDSSIHAFHRRGFLQPWKTDLGNSGSPVYDLVFHPDPDIHLSLGYRVFDPYRFQADSALFFNTTRPYSVFTYQLGSKLEQMAGILHSQNIRPNWNISVFYHKINSPGFYKIQRTNHDNGGISTVYNSPDLHYQLKAAFVYNKEQNDENGGLVAPTQLEDPQYNDRKTLTVAFQNDGYSILRSSVSNTLRDFSVVLNHAYTFGHVDTLYNEDSTRLSFRLEPRFSFAHVLRGGSEKYQFKDLLPDSNRYVSLFTGKRFAAGDSVLMQQQWYWIDNQFLLRGFLGSKSDPLSFSAGLGNKYDEFTTLYTNGKTPGYYDGTYAVARLNREVPDARRWNYQAEFQLYLTGLPAGNSVLAAQASRGIRFLDARFSGGFRQQVSNATYNYWIHQTAYDKITNDFGKQSVTQVFGQLNAPALRLYAGYRLLLVSNYFYINAAGRADQYAPVFTVSQLTLGKTFRFGNFTFENEAVIQQKAAGAPVNLPLLLTRHQLSLETYLFQRALLVNTGLGIRYNTPYETPGYNPLLARFYYQDQVNIATLPTAVAFFNFRIKAFRAYFSVDQLQSFLKPNNLNAYGYATQDPMLRFGFNWVLVN